VKKLNSQFLSKCIEVVIFFFAAFGGFLKNIAPPEEVDSTFAIGISSICTLFILLLISSMIRRKQSNENEQKKWVFCSLIFFVITIVLSIFYKMNIDLLTFPFPPESPKAYYIAGYELTTLAEEYKKKYPLKTISEIVDEHGGLPYRDLVWTAYSIRHAKLILLVNYLCLVLSTATMLFCLTESSFSHKEL